MDEEVRALVDQLAFSLRLRRGKSFTLDAEETIPLQGITAITGPSGSGKTTLLRALSGLVNRGFDRRRIRFGTKSWDDVNISLPPEERRVGFVFQTPALFPQLTVEGNLAYGAKRRDVGNFDAIVEALALGSLMGREVTELSGGEARRVALARALASNPQVLFLDEPMSGLDGDRKAEFLPYIARAVGQARVPALYVSHSDDEVVTLADRVLQMRAGTIIGRGTKPMRLTGIVEGHSDTGALVRVGESKPLNIRIRANVGEQVGLGLAPASLLISSQSPGETSALAVFEGQLLAPPAGSRTSTLKIADQELFLSADQVDLPQPGPVWVSVLKVFPRPEAFDSHSGA